MKRKRRKIERMKRVNEEKKDGVEDGEIVEPEVKEDKTPIGCADFGKLFKIDFKSSSTKDSFLISVLRSANSFAVGKFPKINK